MIRAQDPYSKVLNDAEALHSIAMEGVPVDLSRMADPTQFRDRYEEAIVEMLKSKQAGAAISTEQPAFRGNRNVFAMRQHLQHSNAISPR